MIVLTPEQANIVQGQGLNNSRLQPVFSDGHYLLPEAVLDDPDYIEQHDFLIGLPRMDIPLNVFSDEE